MMTNIFVVVLLLMVYITSSHGEYEYIGVEFKMVRYRNYRNYVAKDGWKIASSEDCLNNADQIKRFVAKNRWAILALKDGSVSGPGYNNMIVKGKISGGTALLIRPVGVHWYLNRPNLSCDRKRGGLLSMFLESTGGKYQYVCCILPSRHGKCKMQAKSTKYSVDGGAKTRYLDRHIADCGVSGFITAFKIARKAGKVQYRYNCCNVSRSTPPCYWAYTAYTLNGRGKALKLDKQKVNCNAGYALSYLRLLRSGSTRYIRYRYRCCKIN